MIERLEQNKCEQLRLRTDVEYKYKRRNVHTEFLSRVVCISLPLKGIAFGEVACVRCAITNKFALHSLARNFVLFKQEGELSRKTVFVVKPLRQVPRLSFNI